MDYVNCQVAIGGDQGNTVPKIAIPVSEVPVLLAIHGDSSLFDFEQVDAPTDAEELTDREEIDRLYGIYGHARDGDGNPQIRRVYAGLASNVVRSIDQLGVPEEAFKVLSRASAVKKTTKRTKAKVEGEAADPGANVME